MELKLTVIDACDLNYSHFLDLQKASYASIIGATGAGYLFTESYYRWKYKTPFGNAKIAIVEDGTGFISANSMYPLQIGGDDLTARGWQSCDTATHPRGRGRGYFMRCLAELKKEIKDGEIFFGFPNKNSTPGFIKFGWTEKANVNTWIHPYVLPFQLNSSKNNIRKVDFSSFEYSSFFRKLEQKSMGGLVKSPAYMNWRYKSHPLHNYDVYGEFSQSGEVVGIVVLRTLVLQGKKLCVALELVALNDSVEKKLIKHSIHQGYLQNCQHFLVINNTLSLRNALLSGMIPVPMFLLPKRQILMGAAQGLEGQKFWNNKWDVQIGDWDGF
jgi:hypothetical protein